MQMHLNEHVHDNKGKNSLLILTFTGLIDDMVEELNLSIDLTLIFIVRDPLGFGNLVLFNVAWVPVVVKSVDSERVEVLQHYILLDADILVGKEVPFVLIDYLLFSWGVGSEFH